MVLEPLATAEDYAERYGEPGDPRAAVLLRDASDALHAAYTSRYGTPWEPGAHPVFDASSLAVCCAVAHRALLSPDGMEGASQYTQTAGPYTASLTLANPGGDVYLTRSDMKRLGLTGCRIGCISPYGGGAHA